MLTLGWRAGFLVGAGLTILALVLVLFALPESIDFLVAKRSKNAVETINRTLKRINLTTITSLPIVEERSKNAVATAIFKGRNGVRSALLGFAFFVMMAAFCFANGWTPRLLEQAGGTAAQGISAGILLNLGGATVALLFGVFAIFIKSRVLTITIAPECYPAVARTSGVGWAVSLGRVGAIISPILAGVLIDGGWTAPSLYMLFALPLVLGGIAIFALRLPSTAQDAGVTVTAETASPAARA